MRRLSLVIALILCLAIPSFAGTGLPLTDDFETAFDPVWFLPQNYVAPNFSIVSTGGYSGDCARAQIDDGESNNDVYTDFYFGTEGGQDASTEITWTGYHKHGAPNQWPEFGNKIGIINLYLSGTRTYQIILGIGGRDGSCAGEFCMENTKVVEPTYYTTRAQNQGTPISPAADTWYKWQVYCKLNTPGASSDVLKLWINDTLKLEYTNLSIRESTSADFGKLNMSGSTTTTADGTYYQYWDEWSLVDGQVGTPGSEEKFSGVSISEFIK